MGIFGTGRDGKQHDVSFGKGGSAVQAHKAEAARRAAAQDRRNAQKAAQARRDTHKR
jgi:hypothetical protein